MTAILGRTGNLVGFTTGRGTTPWNTEMEAALRKQDALLATTVQAITNTLPASANEGDLFLVGTAPTGVAAGWANRIARWRASPSGWEAYVPMEGWIVTIVGETTDKIRRYNGTAWAPIGNDVSMGSISGLTAALAAKLDADSTGAVTDDVLRLNASGVWVAGKALQVNNPTFTGRLSGNDIKIGSASSGGWLQLSPNSTGSGTFSVDFLGGASSNRRMTIRWSDPLDHLLIMSSADDGSARLDRVIVPRSSELPVVVGGGLNVSSGNLSVGGVAIADSSRNGSFARLTTSGAITANGATAQTWGTGYKPVAIGLGSSIAAKNWPSGDTLYLFNNAYRATGDVTKAISGIGNCSALMLQENGGMSFSTVANPGAGATANLVEKFSVDATGALWLNGTTRITAGGDGRFTSLRASVLAASSTYLTRVDANGELIAAPIRVAPAIGIVFEQPTTMVVGIGVWGGSGYNAWQPSAIFPISDDTYGNAMSNLGTGYIWNSQRLNALTITDGVAATPYRGRIKADRWFASSFLQIQNTTTATSWFAAGTGDGSPTIPANYLKQGRRVRIEGRIFCPSCVQNSNPEIALKVGSTTVFTQNKSFTIGPGNELIIMVKADIFIDDSNNLIVLSELKFYSYNTGGYEFPRSGQITPYVGTVANTVDITIKPSSTTESWVRSLAFIEI